MNKAMEAEKRTPGSTVNAYSFAPSPREQFFTNTAFAREIRNGMAIKIIEAAILLPAKDQTSDLDSGLDCLQSVRVKIPDTYPHRSTVNRENSKPR
jgi:hypothetical protein